ncbi:unnamed protein product [marine sediment metagenome]|uniref:PKD-like domain-containing protein n=1 Tax=marine sediment metagenome TaxID=412755 RepID=X1BUJ4_9ZZZZ
MTFVMDITVAGVSVGQQTIDGDLPSLVAQAQAIGTTIPVGDVAYVSRVIDAMPCPARDVNASDVASGATCPCNAPPAPLISGSTNVGTGATETYSVTPQTGFSYAWNVQGGTIISGQGSTSITVDWEQ